MPINSCISGWKNSWNLGSNRLLFLTSFKNLNVWSDGGIIITNNFKFNSKLRLLRNHGLKNRNEIQIMGFNSRLDTIQAVVGNWLIPKQKKLQLKG